ncbi:hypothetical protein TBR22_A20380 [Luteitalea sp. TBR-22]|uniref:gluconate 2-dehydrogenase subunit 3 family protein n=1 Tax=Luteitalea sp. TBR-22 TaxID=2802971 RepID=UPI001AFB0628|nr:gluconate 2-dehydrogenase subunit 3 family protein [Luteitalea sp. TBR-22]BCS32815.1 hypothetical protein TBR22_A20380 [Luteitalea sp. TBR-22]
MTDLNRRLVLALLGAGIARVHLEAAAGALARWQPSPGPYQPTFFTADEHRLLEALSECIIPTTPRSPGARAARVAEFIDLVVAHGPGATQDDWRTQLAAFDATCTRTAGGPFATLDEAARRRVLDAVSARERALDGDDVRAFARVKQATIDAYYTSEIGLRQELGYLGPQMLATFPGCQRQA